MKITRYNAIYLAKELIKSILIMIGCWCILCMVEFHVFGYSHEDVIMILCAGNLVVRMYDVFHSFTTARHYIWVRYKIDD